MDISEFGNVGANKAMGIALSKAGKGIEGVSIPGSVLSSIYYSRNNLSQYLDHAVFYDESMKSYFLTVRGISLSGDVVTLMPEGFSTVYLGERFTEDKTINLQHKLVSNEPGLEVEWKEGNIVYTLKSELV